MHIIALSCSPSHGRNSDSMLDAFLEGVNSVDGVRSEKIYLDDIPIDPYTYANGTGPRKHEKEFAALCNKLRDTATGLVIAAPTYNFSVPARLKNFIDRIRFIALDLTKRNRLGQPLGMLGHLRVYFLISGGTPTWVEKIFFFGFPLFWLRAVFLYYGAQVMGGYYSGDIQTFANKQILAICQRRGRRYAQKLAKGKKHGMLERIFIRPPEMD